MRLLVDTHILLWALAGDRRLDETKRAKMAAAEVLFVSAATIWEIAIKTARGRLRIDADPVAVVAAAGFRPLPITWAHADLAGRLPDHHADPFDRMLIAQAMVEGLPLVTADGMFGRYGVTLA